MKTKLNILKGRNGESYSTTVQIVGLCFPTASGLAVFCLPSGRREAAAEAAGLKRANIREMAVGQNQWDPIFG